MTGAALMVIVIGVVALALFREKTDCLEGSPVTEIL
jgi:hypothetical protein